MNIRHAATQDDKALDYLDAPVHVFIVDKFMGVLLDVLLVVLVQVVRINASAQKTRIVLYSIPSITRFLELHLRRNADKESNLLPVLSRL